MKNFFTSFQAKLFGCFLVIAALSMLVPVYYVHPILHEAMLRDNLERLRQEVSLIGALLETQQNNAQLSAVLTQTEIRLSVMNPQGDVVFESSKPDGMLPENHADRPEVLEAMRSGQGAATRFSTTLRSELIYAALRLENGNIIRLAVPFAGVKQRIDAQLAGFSLAAVAAVALSLLLAWFFSNRIKHSLAGMIRIVEGISLGKFSRRLHMVPGREFRPLANAVNRMAESIEKSLFAVADQKSQLEAVLETMAEGVLVLGPRGRVRRVNNAFAAYFSQDAFQDKGFEGRQIVEIISAPALQEAVSALLGAPDGYGQRSSLQITLNKTVFSVLLARPLKDAADSLGLVAVFHDITELVRLEAVRRDFVANVSHELRTPLTSIQGYAETLEDMEDLPEQARRFAAIIRKHGIFLSGMVDELLTLSRLESDSFHITRSPVKAADALHRARQMLQTALEGKRLRITEPVMPDLMVRADSTLLERVFKNLLENACRYAPEGGEIVVAAQTNGTEAVFTVSDQGMGIPSAELGRIFERFYQVEKHRGASGKTLGGPCPPQTPPGRAGQSPAAPSGLGSGLGLAICKHIVERHHGRIWAESPSANAATTFFFTLPLAASCSGEENR